MSVASFAMQILEDLGGPINIFLVFPTIYTKLSHESWEVIVDQQLLSMLPFLLSRVAALLLPANSNSGSENLRLANLRLPNLGMTHLEQATL